jgi:PPK2 family polyphosphate:nucleotide phosphotransferase
LIRKFVVKGDEKITLEGDFDSSGSIKGVTKTELEQMLARGIVQLAKQQDMLYAQKRWALLVVFQAMDAAGKDSTIKHVMSGVNPQGCQVFSFKAPSTEDLAHDYLWRAAKILPERGCIGIFNRSYYEEVLIVRVHREVLMAQHLPKELADKQIWRRRFEEISNFEKYLVDNGIIVLKFFLHVSKEEQRKRFLERIDMPEKNWKFSVSDVQERQYWDDYMAVYEDCFEHTSSKWAPWYVIPADHKPFARWAVAHTIQRKLEELHLSYPKIDEKQRAELAKAKEILLAEGN